MDATTILDCADKESLCRRRRRRRLHVQPQEEQRFLQRSRQSSSSSSTTTQEHKQQQEGSPGLLPLQPWTRQLSPSTTMTTRKHLPNQRSTRRTTSTFTTVTKGSSSSRNTCAFIVSRQDGLGLPILHPLSFGPLLFLPYNTPSFSSSPLGNTIRPHAWGDRHNQLALFAKKTKNNRKSKGSSGGGATIVAVNRIAYRNYEILDTLEAGISLVGTEVKSVRNGKLNLRDGYIRPLHRSSSTRRRRTTTTPKTQQRGGGGGGGKKKKGRGNNNNVSRKTAMPATATRGLQVHNIHISKHEQAGSYFQHDERRPRTLLVHKEQARKWAQQVEQQPGWTMVPLKAYFTDSSSTITDKNNLDASAPPRAKNKLKLQIALCRGKTLRDKRATIQARDQQRESQRILKSFRASNSM